MPRPPAPAPPLVPPPRPRVRAAVGCLCAGGVAVVGIVGGSQPESPAPRRQSRPAHLPVARPPDLLGEQPAGRPGERGVAGRQPGVGQRDDREHGVPHRRLAGFEPSHRPVRGVLGDGEPFQPGEPALDHRMIQPIAQQVQGDQRVDPGRLDTSPAAVPLLPRDDPLSAPAQGRPPHRPHRRGALCVLLVDMQPLVQAAEHRCPPGPVRCPPASTAGLIRAGLAGTAWSARTGAGRRQLVQPEGQRPDRAQRPDDGQRDDRLPGPARPVIDVEREPGRKVDQFRRHDRKVIPGPLTEQGQPDPGEHPGGRDAAHGPDPLRRPGHMRRRRRVPGQPQRHVGLDRGGQVAGPSVEGRPGAVIALLGRDPPGRCPRLLVGTDAEEFPQQQVLGVHGDVGLQFALPPALLVLQAEQMLAGP